VSPLLRIPATSGLEVFQYGELDYRAQGAAKYPLYAVKSAPWKADAKMVVVTGGVHGYETSGVHGALLFIKESMQAYAAKGLNILVLPCVSPWGYEHIQRWTPFAVDPNRQFNPENPGCDEARQAMACIAAQKALSSGNMLMHADLHETTDTDNTEFCPAKFARDGETDVPYDPIPDGFYTVGDYRNPQIPFQQHVLAEVEKITHIADPDEKGRILEVPLASKGLIYPEVTGICGNHTDAIYRLTTEVYPDSERPGCTPEVCNKAQAMVITAGMDSALANPEGLSGAANDLPKEAIGAINV